MGIQGLVNIDKCRVKGGGAEGVCVCVCWCVGVGVSLCVDRGCWGVCMEPWGVEGDHGRVRQEMAQSVMEAVRKEKEGPMQRCVCVCVCVIMHAPPPACHSPRTLTARLTLSSLGEPHTHTHTHTHTHLFLSSMHPFSSCANTLL